MLSEQTTFCDSQLLTQVSGLVYDKANNLYACNFGTPTSNIIKIDSHGKATLLTEQYTGDRNFVSMVYLDKFLYVTGFNNCVYKVDVHTGELTTFVTLPDNGTNGIAHYDDAFYVVTQDGLNSGNVYKVNYDGTYIIFINKNKLIGTQYNIIVTDEDGNFYITDEGNSTVVKYNEDGDLINSEFISGPYQSILIDKNYIYVTNYSMNQISQYDINGVLINEKFAVGGMTFAGGGLAIAKNGKFYCSLEGENGPGIGNVTIQMITPEEN